MSHWALVEFLNLAEQLSEDTILLENLTQANWSMEFSVNSLDGSINRDSGTCSFDNPEFMRSLNCLKTLPKDKTEMHNRYPEILNADNSE